MWLKIIDLYFLDVWKYQRSIKTMCGLNVVFKSLKIPTALISACERVHLCKLCRNNVHLKPQIILKKTKKLQTHGATLRYLELFIIPNGVRSFSTNTMVCCFLEPNTSWMVVSVHRQIPYSTHLRPIFQRKLTAISNDHLCQEFLSATDLACVY